MLARLDRILLAVDDLGTAAVTWERLFGATRGAEDELKCLAARRLTLGLPESEIELLAPAGPGPVADFVGKWRTGLFGVGFASADPGALRAPIAKEDWAVAEAGDQVVVGPTAPAGPHVVLSRVDRAHRAPVPSAGAAVLRHVYEVTHTVVDLDRATTAYARAFGLDAGKFQAISSKLFGYRGTLTLIDPPKRLDRIEVTDPYDRSLAMGRFIDKRGEGLYMCFAETDDIPALRARLDAAGARYQMREAADMGGAPDVLYVHPSSLCGMLLGASLTGVAWNWSRGSHH
jgi:hypothetical protein